MEGVMESIKLFLANPIVGFVGYILSAVAAIIAIVQACGKNKAIKEVSSLSAQLDLKVEENNKLKLEINRVENKNSVSQGERSQYFNGNTGSVNIDNRG
ncbi:hypothetical protein [Azotobacter salinestris]|uniref:hypothetical protein n=1 Tax=Azotobacter salinestris TaxID=69964 RepID=UPI001266BAD8|nr:hypothetical protein [Azotobacter salinestris]